MTGSYDYFLTIGNNHMQKIKELFDSAKATYDSKNCPLNDICATAVAAIERLNNKATTRYLDTVKTKPYNVFENEEKISRPYLPSLYTGNSEDFKSKWDSLVDAIDSEAKTIHISASEINDVFYTIITAFSCCYDLWNPGARKTPGTFFEVILGAVLGKILPTYIRTKHISIPNQPESVSTDIVFQDPLTTKSLVIPAKITTRERVVQPFAHQRILDSVFGKGVYCSILMCVSEMQRAKKNGANEICVPGTIRLFQNHLAEMGGIYYLDPPNRYTQQDITNIIDVGSIGYFIKNKLPSFF